MGAGWVVAWRLATRNLGLLSTLVLVRLLQPSDFGLVALATGFIDAVDALSDICVQDALVRAPVIDRDLYDTGFGLSVLRGLLTAALIAALAWPIGDFFADGRLAVVMLALSAGTVMSAFENIGIVDFRRDLAFRKEFDMQLRSRIASVAITIAVAVVWPSYWALVVGILVNRTARLVQSYIMSPYRPRIALRAWRRIIGFSLWIWAQTMLNQVRDRSSSVVIGRLVGATQVGTFAVGFELGTLANTEIIEPMNRALFPGFASLHASDKGLGSMFLNAIGLGLLLILPAGMGISMIADPLVRLILGAKWVAAVPVVQITAVAVGMTMLTSASVTLLNVVGRLGDVFYVMVASTGVRVVLLLALVPGFGLPGAAAAIIAGTLVDLVLLLRITLPHIDVSIWRLGSCMLRPAIATLAMVLLLWQLGMAWTPGAGQNPVQIGLDIGIRAGLGAICYGIVLVAAWMVAGRPDGAERHVLAMIHGAWERLARRGRR
jgi:O-antigen/teichoic acid export membrane protein